MPHGPAEPPARRLRRRGLPGRARDDERRQRRGTREKRHGAIHDAKLQGGYDVHRLEPVLTDSPEANLVAGGAPADANPDPVDALWGPDDVESLADGSALFGEDGDRGDSATARR